MIQFLTGDIFEGDSEAIVIPVNCKGVMGAGLALQFKERYSRASAKYIMACARNQVELGEVNIFSYSGGKVIFFPTKDHWRDYSLKNSIRDGLNSLAGQVSLLDIKSIAFPRLGCGLGGLYWPDIKPLMEEFAKKYITRRCLITVYEYDGGR